MSATPSQSFSDATGTDERAVAKAASIKSVYVYEAPVRLWHWINALSIVVLGVTGYFIGSPLPTMPGEASSHYLMGYIRFVHFAAGYVFAVGLLGRLYWAVVGNHHARELFDAADLQRRRLARGADDAEVVCLPDPAAEPRRSDALQPAAACAMFFGFFFLTLFMIVTGFALYGEGTQAGSGLSHTLFTSWVIPLFGQSQDVHTWHHLGLWGMLIFVILHVYAAIREDIMGRQSIVSTMISGHRTFKD